ncbi:hypothetical protein I317_02827 [Kwoniella heveanensis CBS 569]|nr:hypothetical protein I317_02827 [Kwoniella heveanensis CBS 569]
MSISASDTKIVQPVQPMTPNTTVENTIPAGAEPSMSPSVCMKRKASGSEAVFDVDREDKENGSVEKKAKTGATPVVELKGRKLVFKQEPPSRNLPRRPMLKFEMYLADEKEAGRAVTEIPDTYWDLIAIAGHEQTSSNEALLVKGIKATLDKAMGELLPNEAMDALIPKIFTLKQYGFVASDFSPSSSTTKVPAALQIRCWEVTDMQKYLPSDQLESLLGRRTERENARKECLKILDGLDDVEKLELIKGDKGEKAEKPAKEPKEKAIKSEKADQVEESPRVSRRKDREGTANTVESRGRSASPVKKSKMTPEEEEAARLKKEEREAKKTELAEKKACSTSPVVVSDYAKAFRPLPPRPHMHMAEINRWRARRQSQENQDVFVSEQDDSSSAAADVRGKSSKDILHEHLKKHGRKIRSPRDRLPRGLKTMPPYGTVADVWSELQDAEDPRKVLSQLSNRSKYPWKILAFDQQTRPPYCGTFTKKSVVVGPRTPFAQDPIFDYSYDSGDDWQDDEGGEDVDDFGENQEAREDEEDEEDDEDEGEFDDWLDDSEDVEFTPAEGEVHGLGGMDQSRLPMKVVKKSRDAPPKKVVKLTPTWKGPIWESRIGEEGTDGLDGYRIQLLNETPIAIDPFTFVSAEPAPNFKVSIGTTAIGPCMSVRCLLSTEPIAPPKSNPEPIVPVSVPNSSSSSSKPVYASSSPSTSTPSINGDKDVSGKSRLPKIAFPSSHLADLYRAIEGSTKIRTDLVSQLREQFESVTTKAAIEQKIKEVAVRLGKTKDSQWRVKPEAWIEAGLTPPNAAPINPTESAPTTASVPSAAPPAPASSGVAAAPLPPTSSTQTALHFFKPASNPAVGAYPAPSPNLPGSSQDEPMIIDA